MNIYDKVNSAIDRLEYLRGELRSERISTGELLELQGLVKHIAPESNPCGYSEEEQKALDGLRERGYCVIVWSPEEMKRCKNTPDDLEDAVVEYAHDYFFEGGDGDEGGGDDVCDVCGRSGVTCSRTTADGKTMGNECGCADREGDEG